MPSHKTWWRIVLVVVGVLALSGLPQLGPAVIMIGIFTASSAVSARLAWVWMRDGQAKTGWDAWSEAWRVAAVGLVGVLVLNGLHALFGSAALPIGFAATFTALVALVVLRRTPHASGGYGAEAPASTPRRPTAAPAMPPPRTCAGNGGAATSRSSVHRSRMSSSGSSRFGRPTSMSSNAATPQGSDDGSTTVPERRVIPAAT
jgi:hypothetical protein